MVYSGPLAAGYHESGSGLFPALGLKVVQEVIPAYCSKFSKRMFTQLLAILYLSPIPCLLQQLNERLIEGTLRVALQRLPTSR